jgi:hypothetical protein
LLPTPAAADGERESLTYGRGNSTLKGAVKLLPTPHGMPKEGQARRPGPSGNELGRAINQEVKLLPTPMARTKGGTQVSSASREGGLMLEESVKLLPTPRERDHKGRGFEDVRQTVLERVAAESLSTGETLSPRSDDGSTSSDLHLSPWFVEWMMGLPEGWSDPDCLLSATEFRSRWGFSSADSSSSSTEQEAALTASGDPKGEQ